MFDAIVGVGKVGILGSSDGDSNLRPLGQLRRFVRQGQLGHDPSFDLVLDGPGSVVDVVAVGERAEHGLVPVEADVVGLLGFRLPEQQLSFDKLAQLGLKFKKMRWMGLNPLHRFMITNFVATIIIFSS